MSAPAPAPPEDDGGARHLVPGLAMPDIALPATTGGAVSLARVAGLAVVYAYPWTGRPGVPDPPDWDHIPGAHGSTPQSRDFRALYPSFRQLGVEVFGLSLQDTAWQQELVQRLDLPFAILSDDQGALRQALGLPTFETGGAIYLKRLTMIVEDGRLLRAFYPVHPPGANARDCIVWLAARLGYAAEAGNAPRS